MDDIQYDTSCLADMCCPDCKQNDEFEIAVSVWAKVTDEGSETFGDHEWDDNSVCRCPQCGWTGIVSELTVYSEEIAHGPSM